MQQQSIKSKIFLGFGILILASVLSTMSIISGLRKIGASSVTVLDNSIPHAEIVSRLMQAEYGILARERQLVNPLAMDRKIRTAAWEGLQESWKLVDEELQKVEALQHPADTQQDWETLKHQIADWRGTDGQLSEICQRKDQLVNSGVPLSDPRILVIDKQAYSASLAARLTFNDVEATLNSLNDKTTHLLIAESRSAKVTQQHNTRSAIASLVITLALAIGLACLMAYQLTAAIKTVTKETMRLSDAVRLGELNTRGNCAVIPSELRPVLQGIDMIVDALMQPINMAASTVAQLAQGNIPQQITENYHGDLNLLKGNLNQCIVAISHLVADANMLVAAAASGKFETRADAAKHDGEYRHIVEGVNNTLDIVVDKVNWYVAMLDAVPFPIHVTDADMRWAFMNKPFEKLLIEQRVITDRESSYGRACSNANATICNTEACGIKQLHKGKTESFFEWCGLSCKQDTTYLRNRKGEVVGYVEVVQDLTKLIRTRDYTTKEVDRLAENLSLLAKGSLEFDIRVTEADEHTQETKKHFTLINDNLLRVKATIADMITDTNMLVQAALDGRLSTRADAAKHPGEFGRIVQGVNETLDGVIDPINETARVLERLAHNDLTARITGIYKGDLGVITKNLNMASEALATTIGDVLTVIEQVADSTEQIAITSESIGKASQDVANGATQVAQGSEAQAHSANNASQNMEQLRRAIDEVARGAQTQAIGAEQAANAAQSAVQSIRQITTVADQTLVNAENAGSVANNGASIVQKTVDGMNRVRIATADSSTKVNMLGESSKKIGEIVEAINDIAEQTNLLALNAAIEAARAGEHGKGFAVVADEVRKLAERSASQTKEIASLIRSIQDGITAVVTSMASGVSEVDQGVALAGKAGEALAEILSAANNVVAQVKQVSQITKDVQRNAEEVLRAAENVSSVTEETNAATEEMAASSTEVAKAIEYVASITQQSSSVSEGLSAAAEEQNASVEEMTASSRELASMADHARKQLLKFNLAKQASMAMRR